MTKTTYKVGDKVRILDAEKIGYGVKYWDTGVFLDIKNVYGKKAFYLSRNIELISPKQTKNQRIATLEQAVEALQAEVEALKAAKQVTVGTPEILVKSEADITKIAEGFAKMFAKEKKLTPNERRKAIINEAKAFVEDAISRNHPDAAEAGVWFTDNDGSIITDEAEFVVNDKKRTVVVLIKDYGKSNVYTKGIAKCAPGDVFNADISKAIALGLDVSKFEKAVQPSEVVVGQVVKGREETGRSDFEASVTGMFPSANDRGHGTAFHHSGGLGWLGEKQVHIIDDTKAQY